MRSIVCTEYGSPEKLELQDIPEQPLQAGQVRVAVSAAGVNFVDSLLVAGTYQIKIPTPFTPGGDIAGQIVELAEGVADFSIGDRVLASPGIGGFSEQVVLGAEQLMKIPDAMSDSVAATFVQANATAFFALVNRGQLQRGETLLVLGAAGGTGFARLRTRGTLSGDRFRRGRNSPSAVESCATEEVPDYWSGLGR